MRIKLNNSKNTTIPVLSCPPPGKNINSSVYVDSYFKMASLRCCVNSGLLFTIAGCLLMAIGFSTSNWLTPGTKIARLGLWEGCFNNWVYHKDYTAKSYDGCWFLLGGSFKPIWIKLSRCKYDMLYSYIILIFICTKLFHF